MRSALQRIPRRKRGFVTSNPKLHAATLKAAGLFISGQEISIAWHGPLGQVRARLYSPDPTDRVAEATVEIGRPGWAQRVQRQTLTWIRRPGRFGGWAVLWHCSVCGVSCRSLYLGRRGEGGFICRTCAGLSYPSQHVGAEQRRLQRSADLRRRLGQADPMPLGPIPARPKGLHRKTYHRITAQIIALEAPSLAWLLNSCRIAG